MDSKLEFCLIMHQAAELASLFGSARYLCERESESPINGFQDAVEVKLPADVAKTRHDRARHTCTWLLTKVCSLLSTNPMTTCAGICINN